MAEGNKNKSNVQHNEVNEKSRKRKIVRRRYRFLPFMILLIFFIAVIPFGFPHLKDSGILDSESEISNDIQKDGEELIFDSNIQEEMLFLAAEQSKFAENESILKKADIQAAQYDYDGAIATLEASDIHDDEDVLKKINEYNEMKNALVPVNMEDITHIFFHILIVDVERALTDTYKGEQLNAAMTTIPEFEEIIRQMYDRGYVMVHLQDIAKMEEQPDGSFKMVKQQIMLPEGKIPFVMSQDDVNYYMFMTGRGFSDRMVLDEDGKPTNQYTDRDGNVSIGDYDLVPILDKFVEEHPDFAYHGHKAILAFTGYEGVLGYRTDESFDPNSPAFDPENPPNLDIEEDRERVKELTRVLKEDGYEFASHSWGHINFTDRTLESIQIDTDKWKRNVEPLLPEACETLIYPFGADIADYHDYTHDNGKYNYLESVGFRYYCNVDSRRIWMQYGDTFYRQARRNFDGYRLYESFSGAKDRVSDLIDVSKVFDTRRPTPIDWK